MNTKIKLFIILLAFITKISYAQNTSYQHLDTLVTNFVKELQVNHIDTICIYKNYCVGCIHIFDNETDKCNYSSIFIPTYILWLNQGKIFLSKKDNCFDYSTIEIDSTSLWKIFFAYKNQIKKEKVKPFEYVICENHKKNVYFMSVDHSNHQDFKMIINNNIIGMNFDEFNLKKEHDGNLNINYLHNLNLKGRKVIDELRQLVQGIENKQLLTKSRR